MKLLYIISFFAIGQGFFQIFALIRFSKERFKSQLLLSCIIALLSISLLEYALIWIGEIKAIPFLIGFTSIGQFLFCPFIYFFFKSHRKNKIVNSNFFLQLIPFVLILILMHPYFIMSGQEKILHILDIAMFSVNIFSLNISLCVIFILQCLIYFIILISKKEKGSYLFGRELLTVFCIYIFTHIFHSILIYYYPNSFLNTLGIFILLGSTLCIYLLSYYCYRRDRVIEKEKKTKYYHSKLDKIKSKEIIKQFEELIKNEEYFTNSELRISNISSELKVSTQHLSQAINQQLGISYRDYLNKLRVNYAKEVIGIQKDNKLSLKEIAFDSGFNNKTSFLNAFKKHMLMTPTEFVTLHKNH